jgi:hypothetical protein
MTIRPEINALQDLKTSAAYPTSPDEVITVSSATKRMAFAYERFRNTLEPDEEDILRRKAIGRILDRRLHEDRPALVTATSVLQELMRGNYIQPASTHFAQRIGQLITRIKNLYFQLDRETAQWFLELAAVSIDREFFPHEREEALVHLMYHDTFGRVVWLDETLTKEERPAQLYVACHRALFAADNNEIMYHYFVTYFPVWKKETMMEPEQQDLLQRLPAFRQSVEHVIYHPAQNRLLRLLRPAAVPYRIVWDLLQKHDPAIWQASEHLETYVRSAITSRRNHIRTRMNRRAGHSILFLFFTKTVLTFVLELPYEFFLLGEIHWLALSTNTVFHPLLLFFFSTSARLPGESNTERIIDQVKKIVSGQGELPTIVMNPSRHYGAITWSLFAVVYALLFMGIFWGLFLGLDKLHFSLLGMFLFIVFLGLVSFLSVRIRHSVDEIRVIQRREGAISAVFSFLSLPILEFGRWLTQNISQLNIVLFLMDRVLEAPFKLLIDIIEEWFIFVRERKEEIV